MGEEEMNKLKETLFPGEPGWLVALQVGVIVLAILYFGGHLVAALIAERFVVVP